MSFQKTPYPLTERQKQGVRDLLKELPDKKIAIIKAIRSLIGDGESYPPLAEVKWAFDAVMEETWYGFDVYYAKEPDPFQSDKPTWREVMTGYERVAEGKLPGHSYREVAESVFAILNGAKPSTPNVRLLMGRRSMSVGDILVFSARGECPEAAWVCMPSGWEAL